MIDDGDGTVIGRADPIATWKRLSEDSTARLVDVRTEAEWNFVGTPDLSELDRDTWLFEWRTYPGMRVNERFAEMLEDKISKESPSAIYFICRSGARSLEAAQRIAREISTSSSSPKLFNVEEGFEGDPDGERRRGRLNGWKARGLPWSQT